MQKIKLFMVLALLCVGVSGAWGRNYTVEYVGLPAGQTGDYQVTTPWRGTDYVVTYYNNASIYVHYVKNSSTSLTAQAQYYYNRWRDFQDDDDILSNPNWYVKAKEIEGYDATITTRTTGYYNLTYYITITYSPSSVVKWHDDIFEYSTRHTQATGNVQDLPANEVSISLWLGRNEQEFITKTDTVNYFGPLWDNASVNSERELPDYGNNDITAKANYKYLGTLNNSSPGSGAYFYLRTHTVPISTVTEVTIPKEKVYNGKTYKVTAIQKWGFCYALSNINYRYVCNSQSDFDKVEGKTEAEILGNGNLANALVDVDYGNINDHRNDYLVDVKFESPSNVTQIGDYAFMSNLALRSIVVPNSVKDLGQGVWECCRALTDLRFQTLDDGTVQFNTIKNYTFWFCTSLETLVLPEGITTIEGRGNGAPLQFMFKLTDLKLPNSLKTIGHHFVCCCSSLETLTIPAGVTDISGACFHGCESLKTVYLLGKASSLDIGESGNTTFGANSVFCMDHVNNCTFYTTADYLNSYAGNEGTTTWAQIADNVDGSGYLIDENGDYILDDNNQRVKRTLPTTGADTGYGNTLTVIQPEVREFVEGKWVTACFPTDITDYTSDTKFGSGAIAAVMIDRDRNGSLVDKDGNTYTYAQGDDPYRYHVSFEEIEGSTIPANTPILLLPGRTYTVPMMPNINMLTEEQKADLTVPRTVSVNASFTDRSETATITMISKYIDHQRLNVGDFYFISSGNKTEAGATEPAVIGSFKKVKDQAKAPYIGAFRCFWQVNIDNVVDVSSKSSLDMMSYFWNDVDGIKNVESRTPEIVIDGVYDLQGRKLNINQTDLPEGLYIVNGKKVVKK